MSSCHMINQELLPLRQALVRHPVYALLDSAQAMTTFMEYHVFVVWDFMSLLKTLQRELTCVSVPWIPPADSAAARLINEIVLAEESDIDRDGQPCSHFEMYLSAMRQAGAGTKEIDSFLDAVRDRDHQSGNPDVTSSCPAVQEFLDGTFKIIAGGDLCAIASAFTFGRERLLPDVFLQIVASMSDGCDERFAGFEFYLRRHIDLDGDEHGQMSEQLMTALCGDDPQRWTSARNAARQALRARMKLWDAIADAIEEKSPELQLMGLS